LQFFYKYVIERPWIWVDIVKPPSKRVLPDILTVKEVERVINGTRELHYQTFILTAYSSGLRLGETLNLKVGDIDIERMKVHVRMGKGKKDRFVTLPDASLKAQRDYWITHRNPQLLFPNGKTAALRHGATAPMDRGGLQKSFKVIVKSCGIH
jgi:integrase/recombinase XerD